MTIIDELDQAMERSEFFLECLKEAVDDEAKQYALEKLRYWCWKEDQLVRAYDGNKVSKAVNHKGRTEGAG